MVVFVDGLPQRRLTMSANSNANSPRPTQPGQQRPPAQVSISFRSRLVGRGFCRGRDKEEDELASSTRPSHAARSRPSIRQGQSSRSGWAGLICLMCCSLSCPLTCYDLVCRQAGGAAGANPAQIAQGQAALQWFKSQNMTIPQAIALAQAKKLTPDQHRNVRTTQGSARP